VVAKVKHHQGELFPQVGFIVTSLNLPSRVVARFYNRRGTAASTRRAEILKNEGFITRIYTDARQTWPRQTLLVNSKTLWMATLHPIVEGQKSYGCCGKQCSPRLLKMPWPRLNQQSQGILYTGAELNRLYSAYLVLMSNRAA
jgi:hypothetical protein